MRQFQVVGPDEDLKKASDEFHSHAYSLMLLGSFLKTATDHHDIRRRGEVVLLDQDVEHDDHARHMFAAYVRHLGEGSPEVAVLRLLGFFDRAAERQFLDVLRAREGMVYEWSKAAKKADRRAQAKCIEDSLSEVTAPLLALPQTQWIRVLHRLRGLRLIDFSGPEESPSLDAHPLLHECFAEQVRTQFPAAWQAGHRRLFEHLGGTAPYWPEGLEALQPLYLAVPHGCLAELHMQACAHVYHDRILRGSRNDGGFYSRTRIGAISADLGAVACFFRTPWTNLAPNLTPVAQAWLLNQAAVYLRALGRLSEAVEPMRVSMEMDIAKGNWEGAAISAGNQSELELTRGEVAAAVTAGEQSVTYADRSNRMPQQISKRTRLANTLHQAGRCAEARRLFEDVESRQASLQPEQPQLYSFPGFYYCELLLADAEQEAWRRWLCGAVDPTTILTTANDVCEVVTTRVQRWFNCRAPNDSILDIALEHLTLTRATLYKGKLAHDDIDTAVEGIRSTGEVSRLPLGLLTRAWQRCLSGDEGGCRADLDEAWEITERGPMPLFQADIQLTRARLFRDRVALEEARRLIEKHGYHRRDGELADAMEAAQGWAP